MTDKDSIARFQKLFFDRDTVKKAVGVKTRKSLRMWGSYARRRARGMIRTRKKPSKPGQGPTSWGGQLRNFLFFGFDAQSGSVVVGPARINKPTIAHGGKTVPEALEGGFVVDIWEREEDEEYTTKSGKKKTRKILWRSRNGAAKGFTKRTVKVEPRPYMNPAFKYANSKLPELFR